MTKGPFKINSYSNTPYRTRYFTSSPYSNTPYDPTTYIINSFNKFPFEENPYVPNSFNQKELWTAYDQIERVRNARLNLPDKYSRYIINNYNSYQDYLQYLRTQKQQEEQSLLANYNDPLQANSIRDTILGTFNKSLKHSKMFGIDWANLPILNIIPDSLNYAWNYVWKPVFEGKPNIALLNVLTNASETLDVFANPIKANVIALWNGEINSIDDFFKNALRATWGDETGIHNYDYNTGNKVIDILLEYISDPLNWATLGAKGVATTSGKAAINASGDATKSYAKGFTKLALSPKDDLVQAGLKHLDDTVDTSKVLLVSKSGETLVNAGEILEKGYTASLKAGQKRTLISYLRGRSQDWALRAANKKATKVFTKTLRKEGNISRKFAKELANQYSLNTNVTDLLYKAWWNDISKSIVNSTMRELTTVSNTINKYVAKAAFAPTGIYPLYDFAKHNNWFKSLFNKSMHKTEGVKVNRNLLLKETFMDAGPYEDVTEVVKRQNQLDMLLNNLPSAVGKQRASVIIGNRMAQMISGIKDILVEAPNKTAQEINQAVLGHMQSFNGNYKLTDIGEAVELVKGYDDYFKELGGDTLNSSGFEQYIKELEGIRDVINDLYNRDEAKAIMTTYYPGYVAGRHLVDFVDIISKHKLNLKDVIASAKQTELREIIKAIPDVLENPLNIRSTKDLVSELDYAISRLSLNTSNKVLNTFTTALKNLRDGIVNGTDTMDMTNQRKLGLLKGVQMLEQEEGLILGPSLKSYARELPDLMIIKVTDSMFPRLNLELLNNIDKANYFDVEEGMTNLKNSKKYKEVKAIIEHYENLEDIVNRANKNAIINHSIPSFIKTPDIAKRLKVLKEGAEPEIIEEFKTQRTTDELLKFYLAQTKNGKIFSREGYSKLTQAVDTIKDFGYRTQLINEYNEEILNSIVEEAKSIIMILDVISNAKPKERKILFKQHYGKLKESYNTIMRNSNKIERLFKGQDDISDRVTTKGVFSKNATLMPLNKLVEGNNSKIKVPVVIELKSGPTGDYVSYSDLLGTEIKRAYVYPETPEGEIANKYDKEYIQKYFDKDTFPEVYDVKTLGSLSDDTIRLGEALTTVIDGVQSISHMDFASIDKQYVDLQMEGSVIKLQLDKIETQAILNDLPSVQAARQNPELQALCRNLINMDASEVAEVYKDYSPETIQLLYAAATMFMGVDNFAELMNRTLTAFDTLPASDRPIAVTIRTAFLSTIAKWADKSVDVIEKEFDKVIEDITRNVEGYINATDLRMKRHKLDYEARKLGITDDVVYEALSKTRDIKGNLLDMSKYERHMAGFDVMKQALVYEAKEGKSLQGDVMEDIEAQGLRNEYGKLNGIVTEIARLSKDDKGFIMLMDGVVKLPADEIIKYIPEPDLIEDVLGLTEDEWKKLHTATSPKDIYTPYDLMFEYAISTTKLPVGSHKLTFNGDAYDSVIIEQKYKEFNLNNLPVPSQKVKNIYNLNFTGQPKYRYLNYEEQLQRNEFVDYLKLLYSQDRFTLSTQGKNIIRGLVQNMVDNSKKLQTATMHLGRTPHLMEGVNGEFLSYISSTIKNEELLKEKLGRQRGAYIGESLDIMANLPQYSMIDAPSRLTEIAALYRANQGNIRDILKESLDPIIAKPLLDILGEVPDAMRNIRETNHSMRNSLISGGVFDSESPRYDEEKHRGLQNNLADELPSGLAKKALRKDLFYNATQYLSIITDAEPVLGYTKTDKTITNILNFPEGKVDTRYMRSYVNFKNSVDKAYNSVYNVNILVPLQDDIKNMIKDIQSSGFSDITDRLRTDLVNIRFNYAVAKSALASIKAASSIAKTPYKSFAADKLLKQLKEKYPKLIDYIDRNVPNYYPKSEESTRFLRSYLPEEYEFMKSLDAVKAQSKVDFIQDPLTAITNARKTSTTGLKVYDDYESAANTAIKLAKAISESYDAEGLPTPETKRLRKLDKTLARLFPSWNFAQFLQASTSDIIADIYYGNVDHIKTFEMPTDRYFHTLALFNAFTAKKKELVDAGVIWHWEDDSNRLTLELTDEFKARITPNKNTLTKYTRYDKDGNMLRGYEFMLDGEPMYKPMYKEPTLKDFEPYIDTKDTFVKDTLKLRSQLIAMYPEMMGEIGYTNSVDDYIGVLNNNSVPFFKSKKRFKTGDYLPYFNTGCAGDFTSIQNALGTCNMHYSDTLISLAHKILEHSHPYAAYGEFIKTGAPQLDNEIFARMTDDEIVNMLNTHKEYTLAYLRDNKYARGHYEIVRVRAVNKDTLKEARRLHAVVLPWDYYESAARHINNFSYQNPAIGIWSKMIQVFKKSVLVKIGLVFRNVIDAFMKNVTQIGSLPDTVKAYFDSIYLHHQYYADLRDVKKMTLNGNFDLDMYDEFVRAGLNRLDEDTFKMVYDFLERSGVNSLNSTLDGLTGAFLKTNTYVEEVSRLSLYLNLLDEGADSATIARIISQTHFNYDTGSYADFVAKQYIPFWTFISNSIEWLLNTIEEHPHFFSTYFDIYRPIWDIDAIDHDELENNMSLQYQIINGNLPLNIFGFKDKPITRTVQTKFGPKEQIVTNPVVLKMGSSFLDTLNLFVDPLHYIKEKVAPPIQVALDSITDFIRYDAFNVQDGSYTTYDEATNKYNAKFYSTSVQNIFRNPNKLLSILPGTNWITSQFMHQDADGNWQWGNTGYTRTENALLNVLPSVLGATSRWGEFTEPLTFDKAKKPTTNSNRGMGYTKRYYSKRYYPKRFYPRRLYPTPTKVGIYLGSNMHIGKASNYRKYTPSGYQQGVPYNVYSKFLYNVRRPGTTHYNLSGQRSSNMQSIPQYLYSYMGKNKRGRSKVLSWMRMSTPYKVKTTAQRYAKSRGAL